MKINNKGFTLIEMLAVIVVLVAILLVAIPSIATTLEKNKNKDIKNKKNSIISAVEIYASKYKKEFDYNGFLSGTCGISVSKIKEKELITQNELLDSSGKAIYNDNDLFKYDNGSIVNNNTINPC